MQKAKEILHQYWGYDSFRSLQQDAIESVIAGKDVLVLMPTGGGKSLCFQVPAMLQEGLCCVISPLVALMQDQVQALRKRGIPAAALHAGMRKREMEITLDQAVNGALKLLYISPERLQTQDFQQRIKAMKLNVCSAFILNLKKAIYFIFQI